MNGRNFLLSATRAVPANRFAGVVSVLFGCVFLVASCAKPAAGPSCSGGLDSCGTTCVDTATNHDNCGACGTACSATQECTAGKCQCQTGYILCGGACVASDASNCGSCGTKCTGAANVCSNGTCGTTCPSGTTMCTGGACVDFTDSNLHCGSCTNACRTDQVCTASSCVCPTGQSVCNGICTAGTCGGGTGGTTTGTGGSSGGTGGKSGAGGSTTGAGGSTTGTGGMGVGGGAQPGTGGALTGVGGTSGRSCAVASTDVISDFEEGFNVMVNQGGRTGYWLPYNDSADPQNQTPAKPATPATYNQVPAEPPGQCMMSAFHSSATGQTHYVGFGAQFHPNMPLTTSAVGDPYDVSQWDGITFKAKTGGDPASQPVFVELLSKETQPTSAGGTATVQAIDLYNNRGFVANIASSTYQTFYIPFGAMIPRSLPEASTCGAMTTGGPKCQAPRFVSTNALGIQFSWYGTADTPGLPRPTTIGSYNVLIDDVAFYHRSASTADLPALPSSGGTHPLAANATINSRCSEPTGANGQLIALAYDNWKKKFVVAANGGFKIIRPENSNDTVSEGIGYGMLIAVYMDDKALFDGLYTYWKANLFNGGPLMVWNNTGGAGTATDADEDAAFAMLMASKQWSGGTYASDATTLMHAVLSTDMSGTFIKAGSNYTATGITNPSYFAPAWYRAFARADTTNATAWNNLASGAYTLLGNISGSSSNGLYGAWCQNNCASPASNGAATDMIYQYDSHRIPWRIGTDYCWNGTAQAKTYVDKTSAFFSSPTHGGGGVGRLVDLYNLDGTDYTTGQARNSASIIGTSAVGAMANTSYGTYLNDAYQFVLDISNRGTINDRAAAEINPPTKTSYSYFNATVGILTLLTMNGNLQDWTQ